MKDGATILPIERGNAILLITDIPAQVCANCGELYLYEDTAHDVQELANETLAGEVSYTEARGDRTVLVAPFA
jgi:YgiT-type zinc finger domain-containing protein